MSGKTKPANQAQAEKLAKAAVEKYLNDCNLESREHLGNCLMKLVSVAGVLMGHNEGGDAAFDRLVGTAHFVRKNAPATPSELSPVQ